MKNILILSLLVIGNHVNAQYWGQIQKFNPSVYENNEKYGAQMLTHNNLLIVSAAGNDYDIDDNLVPNIGCVYVYELDANSGIINEVKLSPSDGQMNDAFGSSIAAFGDYIIVSSPNHSYDENGNNYMMHSGAVYVFKKNTSDEWVETQKLVSSTREELEGTFGSSISIFENKLVLGSLGKDYDDGSIYYPNVGMVYYYELDDFGYWDEKQTIIPNDIVEYVHFGWNTILNDEFLFISSPDVTKEIGGETYTYTGEIYVYKQNLMDSWEFHQIIERSEYSNYNFFGSSLTYGDDVLVCPIMSNFGKFFTFELDVDGLWKETSKLTCPDSTQFVAFGSGRNSVIIENNRLFIGGSAKVNQIDGNTYPNSGVTYYFEKNSENNWVYIQPILPNDINENDKFGSSIATIGDYLYISSSLKELDNESSLKDSVGCVFVFDKNFLQLSKLNESKEFNIYPNPSNETITINNIENSTIHIYNQYGALVGTYLVENKDKINVSDLNSGIYFIVNTENNQSIKFIKI